MIKLNRCPAGGIASINTREPSRRLGVVGCKTVSCECGCLVVKKLYKAGGNGWKSAQDAAVAEWNVKTIAMGGVSC